VYVGREEEEKKGKNNMKEKESQRKSVRNREGKRDCV